MELFKNMKYLLSALAVVSLTLVSCEEDQNLNYSPLEKTNPTVTVAESSYDAVFAEGDTSFVFNLSASVEQIVDIPVDLISTENIGFTGDEFSYLGGEITKGTTDATAEVVFEGAGNSMPSAMQKLTVQVGDSRTSANATYNPVSYTFTVLDYDVMLSWGGLCEADFDILFLSGGADIGYYPAATGACPETADLAVLPDGTYDLYLSLFNAGNFSADDEFPVLFEASNNGGEELHSIETNYVVGDGDYVFASVVVNGNTITLRDAAGNTVGTL